MADFRGWFSWGCAWALVSLTLISLGQAVTEVRRRPQRPKEEEEELKRDFWFWCGWAWSCVDVGLRSLYMINFVYAFLVELWQGIWWWYLSRQVGVISNLTHFVDTGAAPFSGVVQAWDDQWTEKSILMDRGGGWAERAWVFTPAKDTLLHYVVQNSWMGCPFFAFYPAQVPAIFPPAPLRTYWSPPSESPIASATWRKGSCSIDCTPVLVELLKQCAGPSQTTLPTRQWLPKTLQPPPELNLMNQTEKKQELTPSELRRLKRQGQASLTHDPQTLTLLLTRQNQTVISVNI